MKLLLLLFCAVVGYGQITQGGSGGGGGNASVPGAGIVKSNGTALQTAVAGTDYVKGGVGVLTDAATITTDCSVANHFRVTLGGNRTLAAPTNPTDGQKATWVFIQDATGSRTITLDPVFSFGTDVTGVTLTTTANKRDFMGAIYSASTSKWYVVSFAKGY